MSEDLGSAHGSVVINAASALATLASLRRQSASTVGTLNTIGRASITAGVGIAGVGAGIAAMFALAVNKSAEIERKISYISGITGIHGKEVDVVREKIIQLGQDSAYTATEVADGFTELSKAGATVAQLTGGVGDAMITLGQSADIGLADAATALISISSTFDLTADKASHIADVLQGAANSSIISVEDMAVSFKYAGGVAANLGISLEDTATAIAILGNAGIRGSTAGTSLRRIFLQLTPRTDKAADAMKKLGIITKDGTNRFYDAEGKAKNLAQVTQILHDSTKDLTAEMKQKALATIFGDRAINSAIALSKGGAKSFNKMSKTIGNVKAADVAAKRLDNLAGKWEILKGTIDSALIRAGAPAQKPLQEIVVLVTKLVNAFNKLSPSTQAMIIRFALITAGLLLLTGGFLIVFGTLLRAIAIFKQLAMVFKIVRLQILLFTSVMKAANGAFLLSPIGLVVLAIIALVVAFVIAYKKSEKFRAIVDKVAKVLKNAAIAVWNFLKQIPEKVSAAWTATSNFFKNIYNTVKNFISSAIGFVKDHWKAILFIFSNPLGLILVLVWKFRSQILSFLGTMVQKVLGFFAALPGRIGFILGFIIGRIIRFAFQVIKWLLIAGRDGFMAIVHFFMALPGRIWNLLVRVVKFIGKWVPILVSKAISAGRSFLSNVISFFKKLPGRIWHFLLTSLQKLGEFERQAIKKALELGGKVKDSVLKGIKKIPGLIRDALGKAIQVFKDMLKGAWKAAKDFAGGLWKGFKKGLFGSPRTKIEYAMEDMNSTVEVETKNLASQIRLLQRIGKGLPAFDQSVGTPRVSARSVGTATGNSTSNSTMIVNVNNPSRTTVTQSADRGLKELAYANGWNQ